MGFCSGMMMASGKPLVKRRISTRELTRRGRGFSSGELREAGLSVDQARRLGLYVDLRRKTVHVENVKVLKEIASGWRKS